MDRHSESEEQCYEEIVESIPSLEGKVVAITGCTSGTGYWTARAAIVKKASLVVLLNRASERADKAQQSFERLAKDVSAETVVTSIACDLSNFASVRAAAKSVNELVDAYFGLDVLINNAGISCFPDGVTMDGFEVQMQTNYLGHFLLTNLLFSAIVNAGDLRKDARVVGLTSMVRNTKMGPNGGELNQKYLKKSTNGLLGGNGVVASLTRYHMSKLACVVFNMALHDKLQASGILNVSSVGADPGLAQTEIFKNGKQESNACTPLGCYMSLFNVIGCLDCLCPGNISQSAADGACSLILAAFGTDTNSGDLFAPKTGMRGKPKKVFLCGVAIDSKKEAHTMNLKSREMLWSLSEKAVGAEFTVA